MLKDFFGAKTGGKEEGATADPKRKLHGSVITNAVDETYERIRDTRGVVTDDTRVQVLGLATIVQELQQQARVGVEVEEMLTLEESIIARITLTYDSVETKLRNLPIQVWASEDETALLFAHGCAGGYSYRLIEENGCDYRKDQDVWGDVILAKKKKMQNFHDSNDREAFFQAIGTTFGWIKQRESLNKRLKALLEQEVETIGAKRRSDNTGCKPC